MKTATTRAPALAALFAQYKPGKSVEVIAREAAIQPNRLRYLFRKERTDDLPGWTVLQTVASALGCTITEVVTAMAEDAGHPLDYDSQQNREEGSLLTVYRDMAKRDRKLYLAIGRTIVEEG